MLNHVLSLALYSNTAALSGAAAGGAFSLSSLSPSIWTEAGTADAYTDAGTTHVSADGQAVQQWNDKSGNARNLSQATSTKRPLYKTTTGKPSILFDGVDDVLASAAFSPVDASGQHWVALSLTFPTNTGTQIAASLDDGTGSLVISRSGNNAGTLEATSWDLAQAQVGDNNGGTYTANTAVVLIYTVTTSGIEVFINNVSDGAAALTGTRATGSVKAFLGAYVGVTNWANVHLYGFVSGPGLLGSTDRASLQTYMAALHP